LIADSTKIKIAMSIEFSSKGTSQFSAVASNVKASHLSESNSGFALRISIA
jgi:hypothetical protein